MFDPCRDFVLSLTNVNQGGEQGHMIRDVEHETMPREDLEALQLRRLQAVVERVYHLVPFYRRRMDELGVKPEHIRTLRTSACCLNRQARPATTTLRHVRRPLTRLPDSRLVRHHGSHPVAYTQRDLKPGLS
jgi:hypothetical protein